MPQVNFKIKYADSSNSLLFDMDYFTNTFMFGIPLCTQNGVKISRNLFNDNLLAAQNMIEQELGIKLFKQNVAEQRDFQRNEFDNWGFLRCTYPIRNVLKLEGFVGNTKQVAYPSEWVSIHNNSTETNLIRNLYIVPSGAYTANYGNIIYAGILPHIGFMNATYIPNYWFIEYETGFDKIPADIVQIIGKSTAIQMLAIVGDVITGNIGVSSTSLSFDGLSQSKSYSGNGSSSTFGARIKQYQTEIVEDMKRLKGFYKGIPIIAI